jgi:hypothetical protein
MWWPLKRKRGEKRKEERIKHVSCGRRIFVTHKIIELFGKEGA